MKKLNNHVRMKIPGGRHLVVENHTVHHDHPLHWHSFFEIEIVIYGVGKYTVNDTAYDLMEKNVFFLSSTDFHNIEVEGDAEVINISFDEETVDERILSLIISEKMKNAYSLDKDEYSRIVASAELLKYEVKTDGECQRELLKYIIYSLFKKSNITDSVSVNYEHYRGIKKAITYMEMNFRDNITLEFIAAEAGYNKNYFSELFKKITGQTYIEKLTRLRVGYARTLLANGFSVSDAAHLSGFGSLSGFLSSFKRTCGVSPREYKRKQL